ncbi:serine/threonine-protein kinase polo [Agrilus planipennis]|uniref:polo kinase n=1 Tax=Agrilus planipennis TaxID=224129 RepID=A0A1W4WHE2_AGRPL|nr:serine/threonine-protein kinase polo [Agrilus planipennis]
MSDEKEIPNIIYDSNTKISYKKGRFFGKGGFAKCYEITDMARNATYAGKIVSKKIISKQNQREKMTQEISIHRTLKHKNIVGFHSFFEDNLNVYIVLELCRRRSMMELQRRRKTITEPETRFYMKQILSGVSYLHFNKIIHRDLKLGNLFLNDDLHVKIGDFGLAAKIKFDGERKDTLCGTPNYIAPEILTKKGHSFEVDVWSIGCIMYTLLFGKPPFETDSLKETYSKIKKCDYRLSPTISQSARDMIMLMLQPEPKSRPKVQQLINHDFIINGYLPPSLPVSTLTMAPLFNAVEKPRVPLVVITPENIMNDNPSPQKNARYSIAARGAVKVSENVIQEFDPAESLDTLKKMILRVLKSNKEPKVVKLGDEMTDPAAQPLYWISKWVDYSDKYGFGYQLCDEGVGVMFNDTTKLIMLPNGINVHFIDKNGKETYFTINNYPEFLEKKVKLLSYFGRYMKEHLVKAGENVVKETDNMSRIPHLFQWCRSTSGVLMQLNNGTVQINFSNHTKIIMCPLMGAITYIDEDKSFRTFRFSTLEKHGYSKALYEKMKYARDKITVLLENENK